MDPIFVRINNRNTWIMIAGSVLISATLLFGIGEIMNVETSDGWWLGWLVIEVVVASVLYVIFQKLVVVRQSVEPHHYEHQQLELLRQLNETKDFRIRQIILDKMMGEDLLRGADLSNVVLTDIHLENANLAQAHLQHAILPKADLEGANLQEASLNEADLNHADLVHANLCKAELRSIHLEGAILATANLSGANLQYAMLGGASLYDANLSGVQLDYADLRGCCMLYAHLQGASLNNALFDEHTVLPDGEKWTTQLDLSRFTNASHPQYKSYQDADDSPVVNEKTA
ncbi:MAG: pentapeptide repeat-containing protein [Anaerolineae bacterium]|nr:pentapeptide repeat-containing protein [Anaerolineae bacterium]